MITAERQESAFAGLRDAARHAHFEALPAVPFSQRPHVDMDPCRNRCAIDEEPALGMGEEAFVTAFRVDVCHRAVVRGHGDHGRGQFGDARVA
jgi:hypothetical protein